MLASCVACACVLPDSIKNMLAIVNLQIQSMTPVMNHLFAYHDAVAQGQAKCDTWKDEWTVVTKDGGLAAQYEHTILITPDGAEILTLP